MNDAAWFPLFVVAVFGAYRQFCIFQFYRARRRNRPAPFRGVVLRFPTRS